MKKYILFLAICVAITVNTFAQSPEAFNYQTVVRDAGFKVIPNQLMGMQMTILQGSSSGAIVYQETFALTTNAYGLVNFEIGSGTVISGIFANIDWSAGPYFIETAIDATGGTNYLVMGASELISVPYSLYSKTAGFADSADYNSLSNLPTTISDAQIAKIDSITVTEAIDLDLMATDVVVNNAKVSFPGFGTVPGTALEGDNVIWIKKGADLFYNGGSVGIHVDTTSSFRGSALHVGGGILFDGKPTMNTPGMLYYDSTGFGTFRYFDNANNETILGAAYKWNTVDSDVTTTNDVIINGSLGVGFDAINGEDFGFNTFILKENNLRILFDDTDDPAGPFPFNDWQIEINESINGGTSHFAIKDITNATTPFKVMAGAPDHSFYVKEDGNVGIGTNAPTAALEVNGNVKANTFIGDGSGLTGITGGTGGIANADNTTIGADTDSDNTGEIALQTQNITRMTITNDGKVGIGTTSPATELDVVGTGGFQNVVVSGNTKLNSITYGMTNFTDPTPSALNYDVSNKSLIVFNSPGIQTIDGFMNGLAGQEITISTTSANVIINHYGAGTQKVLIAGGTNITLTMFSSARFVCDGTSWFCIGLNN